MRPSANNTVLVIGPGRTCHGGITASITTLARSALWREYRVRWLETLDDSSALAKCVAAAKALLYGPAYIWGADIVHIHVSSGRSFHRKSIFAIMAKLFRKKLVLQIHPAHFVAFYKTRGHFMRGFVQRILRAANLVLALSPAIGAELQKIVPSATVRVLPNPCPFDVHSPSESGQASSTILYVGKLAGSKGCYDLLEAFREVRSHFPACKLVMAGDGSIAECRIRAVELGIEDAVELKGWLPTKEVIRAYSRAAIFCLPSYSEGLPMVVLEAMALGLPVISTSVGGIPDIIVTGENGLLIAPGDVEALAGAIITLLRDSTLRFRLSQRAMGTVRARYSVDTIASQLRAYYQELLPSRAAKGANVGVSKH